MNFLSFFQSPQSKCLLFHLNNIFILNFGYYIMHRMCISTDLDTSFRILVINSVRNRFQFWGSSFLGSKLEQPRYVLKRERSIYKGFLHYLPIFGTFQNRKPEIQSCNPHSITNYKGRTCVRFIFHRNLKNL